MKGLGFVDLEASRPGAVGGVHEAHTQQLVVVVAGPVEDNAGARQGGDVTLRVGRTLGQMYSLMTSVILYLLSPEMPHEHFISIFSLLHHNRDADR